VKHFTAYVVTFPLYIAVLAFIQSTFVAGRIGPRVRRGRPSIGVSVDGSDSDVEK
jgi:hypothetical protein